MCIGQIFEIGKKTLPQWNECDRHKKMFQVKKNSSIDSMCAMENYIPWHLSSAGDLEVIPGKENIELDFLSILIGNLAHNIFPWLLFTNENQVFVSQVSQKSQWVCFDNCSDVITKSARISKLEKSPPSGSHHPKEGGRPGKPWPSRFGVYILNQWTWRIVQLMSTSRKTCNFYPSCNSPISIIISM